MLLSLKNYVYETEKLKNFDEEVLIQVKIYIPLFLFHYLFPLEYTYRFLWWSQKSDLKQKYLVELIKRRSKFYEKNMSRDCASNFDQWKRFSGNYEPIRDWFWFVNKITAKRLSLLSFYWVHSNSVEVPPLTKWVFWREHYLSY